MYLRETIPAEDQYRGVLWTPLYTAPPQREWQGLTDEEVLTVMQSAKDFQGRIAMAWVNHENQTYVTDVGNRIARAIEAKLKEKNI